MYEKHFGLKDKPFNLAPDPDYLYLSSKHRMGLSLMEYGLMETAAGLSVITGHVGAGKTTLIRKLLRRIDHNQLTIGMINNTTTFQDDLVFWVANAFNLPHAEKDTVTLFREFQQFLIKEYAQGRRCVLIVDEAQNLGEKALEQLRMLTNINADRDQLLQIVLVGQPELYDILQRPEMAQIAQRVSVEHHLEPLDYAETKEYIRHRLEVAGTEQPLFDDDAVKLFFLLSGGVPRLINTLCDYALVHAYALDKQQVDREIALSVLKGRKIGGINRHAQESSDALRLHDEFKQQGLDIRAMISA
jgi:general secretion pathway protein A